jgi:type IV secretory pathway VirB10-like protein
MRALRAILLAAALVVVLPASTAVAQVSVDPSVTPELNTGGWIHGMAILLGVIGLLAILLLVAGYVRFAPRFSTDESTLRVVRADRVRPGEELPRRTVDIKAAAPVVVGPPPLPQPADVAASSGAPAAAPAAATAPAPAATAPAPAQAGPGAEAPSTEAPQAAPASEGAPAEADGATEARETPAAETSAPAPAPAAGPERPEVSLDQEVFDQTLKELLEKGTDKRVAEGQARRAAMIAARKKAAGEA